MSTAEIIVNNENSKTKDSKKKYHGKSSEMMADEDVEKIKNKKIHHNIEHIKNRKAKDNDSGNHAEKAESFKTTKELIHVYDKETLLDLRSAPGSLQKPECLSEDFFNKDGVWDPEAWHKSNTSRSASPAVDGRTVTVEGKKIDLLDDNIQLTPHRGSFKQGCHVQAGNDKADRIGPRAVFDKKNRLTGRAAGQRRNLENPYEKDEKQNRFDRFSNKDADKFYDRYEKNDHHRRNEVFHSDKKQRSDKPHYSAKGHRGADDDDENLPEWMTEGPATKDFDFTGFQDLEEEKKAYAKKKKKVRMSPDVEKQEEEKEREREREQEMEKLRQKKNYLENKGSQNPETVVAEEKSVSSKFDINEFFNEVDYYPPHLFPEDVVNSDGVRSRFTQWFQAQHHRSRSDSLASNDSRPDSITNLVPNELITGARKSPVAPSGYFAPIQPAPALVNAAASAHAVQTSNILSIIRERRKSQEEIKANLEVKGRLSLKDLEDGNTEQRDPSPTFLPANDASKSAFDMLVMSMKEAGQLPEKPAPVVTGLPDHLLPQPPKRTSPTFEKLKQSLNRSPSPSQLRNAVTTLAGVISTYPSLQKNLDDKQIVPGIVNRSMSPVPNQHIASPVFQHSSFFEHAAQPSGDSPTVTEIGEILKDSVSQSQQQKKLPSAAFTPTSVLKQLHNEKQRESPVPTSQALPDVSFIDSTKKNMLPDLVDVTRNMNFSNSMDPITPIRSSRGNTLPFHSAPTTPRNQLNLTVGAPTHSASMPATPDHSFHNDPPPIHRMTALSPLQSPTGVRHVGSAFTPTKTGEHALLAPSAFKKHNTVGVIGSGVPLRIDDSRFSNADPRLAPGNGATRLSRPFNLTSPSDVNLAPGSNMSKSAMQSTPLPQQHMHHQSQQQQLLHAQRMAQIQQAQLQQQQKLQQIANQANHQKLMQQKQQQTSIQDKQFQSNSGVGPLLPDPDSTGTMNSQQLRTPAEHRLQQQQQQRAQIHAYQQQQHKQQQAIQQQHQHIRNNFPNSNFRGGRPFQQPSTARNSPPIPMPLQQPTLPMNPLNRPQTAMQNLTAQVVQQQLLTRARFLAQAQLLQQQPQVFQAALMAQAALARGQAQAQAQAAMMLNPRNIQAMAEQMGIRPPHMNNKAIPTPMVTSHNQSGNLPKTHGFNTLPTDNDLSKWFTPDVLQKIPQGKGPTDIPTGKVLSVEELEQQAQRSS